MQRRAFLGASGVGAAALAGCFGLFGDGDDEDDGTDTPGNGGDDTPTPGGTPEPDVVVVRLQDNQFDPRNLSVEQGTTVRWTNEDAVEHTITSASDNWSVDMTVPPGESREYTFEADGVYEVYCRFHGADDLSGMAMKIAVGDATIDDPLPDDDYPY